MKFLKIAILLISLSGFSQSKVGAVDIEYILSQMPELNTVQHQMEAYGKKLDSSLNKRIAEYKKAVEDYKTREAGFTEAQKKEKQTNIINLETDIQKFQENGSKLINIKNNEYLQPLYQKIGVALEKVAKTQGYTQVMQTSNDMVYLDPSYDLTVPIIEELGIEIKKEE